MKSGAEKLILFLLITGFCFAVKAQPNNESFSPERIYLTAAVSDENGFLKNLTAEDFEVYLEDKRGSIDSVKHEDEPVSIGFLVDISASMRAYRSGKPDKMVFGVKGVSSFLAKANRANDYFVLSFGKELKLVLDSTQDGEKVKRTLAELAENKLREPDTKFYEALKTGVEKIKGAKNQKKVLILISDGQDNSSTKLDPGDIRKSAGQSDVLLYIFRIIPDELYQDSPELGLALRKVPIFVRDYKRLQFEIAPFPTSFPNEFLRSARSLDDFSSASGGRGFYPLDQAETDKAFEILADELKSQYRFVINPPAGLKKNRAGEMRIKIPKLKDVKKVSVRTRKEIYF